MKNGLIRFIPLQSELCLNKQKVDITDFKGWQKCNAPVYGDCLSPLYKKNDTHHDIYIGNDNYDFTSGKLYKNGVEVLSGAGAKKLKKTKVNQDYKSLAISEDNVLTWAKEASGTSFTYSLHGSSAATKSLTNCTRIVEIKCFADSDKGLYGIAVLYLHTNGKPGYYLVWNDGGTDYESYGESNPTTWSDFELLSPLIQVGLFAEHKFMVSFFSASGANIPDTTVKNVYVESGTVYENPTFKNTSMPTRYEAVDDSLGISIDVTNTMQEVLIKGILPAIGEVRGFLEKQTITIYLSKALTYNLPVKIKYYTSGNWTDGETLTVPAGTTQFSRICTWNAKAKEILGVVSDAVVEYHVSGAGQVDPASATQKMYPAYLFKENNEYKSSLSFEVTVQSDADPNNPTTAPQTSTRTTTFPTSISGSNSTNVKIKGVSFSNKYGYKSTSTQLLPSTLANVNSYLVGIPTTANYIGFIYATDFSTLFSSYTFGSQQPKVAVGKNNVTSNSIPNISGEGGVAIAWKKQEYTVGSLGDVDCCMDSGVLFNARGLTLTSGAEMPAKIFALSGTFTSFNTTTKEISYGATSVFNIAYDADEETNVFPRYYDGMSLSLSNHLLRTVYRFRAKQNATDIIYIMIDSLGLEEGQDAAHLYPGVKVGTGENIQGGVKNTTATSGWRFLFNNNMLSNVGCYEKKEYIGTILADWFTVDERFCPAYNSKFLYYRDNANTIWKLELVDSGEEWSYKLVENRYVVLNTVNYFNCYDTKTGLKRHWASDYNNRIIYGKAFSNYTNDNSFKALLSAPLYKGFMITGQNANYEVTQDTITSIELGAIQYEACLKEEMAFISCNTPYGAVEGIDYYRGDGDSTAALYINSFTNGTKYINTDLKNPDATYPIGQNADVRFNPNLFTRFISSYNNKDMVISDGVAYRLIYYNNVIPIMSYFMLDGVEELESAFVLQTSFYGVSKTRLYQMNYSNGVGVDVIADITNLEYLGALPSQALFWSAQNRAIYSFKGNCIMQLSQYANDLTGIYGKWYNPATQELFLDTNIGILVFSDLGTYCLEWSTETQQRSVADIFFFEDYFIVNLVGDTTDSIYYSYNKKEGYESNKVYFITKYYGNGLAPITVNNIYVRLYDQAELNAPGFIKMKGYTITDKGTHTDEKTVLIGGEDNPEADPPTVAGEAWDEETGTLLVKYTPQYNRGLGFALELETTFPIIDIKFDYVENGTIESQIAHVNI